MAQRLERLTADQQVPGSIPGVPSLVSLQLVGWLGAWMVGWMVGWLIGRLLAGCLVG